MKIITIITTLAALPLVAQEQAPTQQEQQVITCSCPSKQSEPKCPQAAMAAAFGFQRGYHMGFESGFAEAIQLVQKAEGCCKACGRHGKNCKHGKPECAKPGMTRPMPQPQMQPAPPQPPAPQPAPQAA